MRWPIAGPTSGWSRSYSGQMSVGTKMWIWGFVAGVCLMGAIQALGQVLDGDGWLSWIQLVSGIVVVAASVGLLLQARRADGSDSGDA
jgi:hypothetical protein